MSEDNPNAPLRLPKNLESMHRALRLGCNLPPMRPSDGDGYEWFNFMQEMKPLEETEEGGLRLIDLIEALAHIRKENEKRDPKYRTRLNPSSFLRDPIKFRDLVDDLRRQKRLRPRPKIYNTQRSTPGGNVMVEVDPAAESEPEEFCEALCDELANLSQRLRKT